MFALPGILAAGSDCSPPTTPSPCPGTGAEQFQLLTVWSLPLSSSPPSKAAFAVPDSNLALILQRTQTKAVRFQSFQSAGAILSTF